MRPGHGRYTSRVALHGSRKPFLDFRCGCCTNGQFRHAHIYGIDLASPSELIAHHRDEESIARHIGAAKVIFQTLDDLKAACASLSPRKNQEFEVGVFCGSYVTPVSPDYFEHLERIRGESKKAKVLENARQAVANGSAGEIELQMARNGVEVSPNGTVEPASPHCSETHVELHVNGDRRSSAGVRMQNGEGETTPPKERMDISLHNFGDYTQG